jgi:hypothetical protein
MYSAKNMPKYLLNLMYLGLCNLLIYNKMTLKIPLIFALDASFYGQKDYSKKKHEVITNKLLECLKRLQKACFKGKK